MVDSERRQKIRESVAAPRAAAIRFRDEIDDVAKKDQLRLVLHFLDDVDGLFLDSVDPNRTATQESEWLDHAEHLLQIALKMLLSVK